MPQWYTSFIVGMHREYCHELRGLPRVVVSGRYQGLFVLMCIESIELFSSHVITDFVGDVGYCFDEAVCGSMIFLFTRCLSRYVYRVHLGDLFFRA